MSHLTPRQAPSSERSIRVLSIASVQRDSERASAQRKALPTFVLLICNLLGDKMRATREVENSISTMATSPDFDSEHFAKGSVVYIRYPRDVAGSRQCLHADVASYVRTDCKVAVILVEGDEVHGHLE